ncbi:hypothetical protein BDP27DRAFT_1362439 [Rhodocollybia butyracea]|uniref:Zn(2)-C6 fungal-type domain-containing protein n=1 Tax=Rhodocollybia butyracea TaxID=206335 RepID=A0A9P5PWV2_9AGAR|nr:hypothetical protein BDP27DRAFT_1362439 [Rhodocollybia butyracea]
MSSPASTSTSTSNKRRRTAPSEKSKPKPVADDDHRKRRRNRTTQSCLNCHTSKRMCDRKRPACARCTQLGLTGLCVYEVDDPTQQSETQDESSRLLKRVAELEGVIRELKNKPHPRWASSGGTENPPASPTTSASPGSSHSVPPLSESPTLSAPFPATPPSDTPPVDVAIQSPYSSMDLDSIFAQSASSTLYDSLALQQQLDDMSTMKMPHSHSQPCSCVLDPTAYQTMLELSLRLRKAAMALGQYPLHQAGAFCLLHERLAELETLTTNSLSAVDSPRINVNVPPYNHRQRFPSAGVSPTTLYSPDSVSRWVSGAVPDLNTAGNDGFMSWEPPRRP